MSNEEQDMSLLPIKRENSSLHFEQQEQEIFVCKFCEPEWSTPFEDRLKAHLSIKHKNKTKNEMKKKKTLEGTKGLNIFDLTKQNKEALPSSSNIDSDREKVRNLLEMLNSKFENFENDKVNFENNFQNLVNEFKKLENEMRETKNGFLCDIKEIKDNLNNEMILIKGQLNNLSGEKKCLENYFNCQKIAYDKLEYDMVSIKDSLSNEVKELKDQINEIKNENHLLKNQLKFIQNLKKENIEDENISDEKKISKTSVKSIKKESKQKSQNYSFEGFLSKMGFFEEVEVSGKKKDVQMSNFDFAFEIKNKFAGIRNLGSTCYLNCIVQLLFFTPEFKKTLDLNSKLLNDSKSLTCALNSVFLQLKNFREVTEIERIIALLDLRIFIQMDVSEVLKRVSFENDRKLCK